MARAIARTELPYSPSRVREIFLDFPSWPQWATQGPIRSVSPIPEPNSPQQNDKPSSPLPAGSKAKVCFGPGMTFTHTISENSPERFSWKISWPLGIMSAEHSFRFLKSETTPGGTTFVNEEHFEGGLVWLIGKVSPNALGSKEGDDGSASKKGQGGTSEGFEKFNECFKARVESMGA